MSGGDCFHISQLAGRREGDYVTSRATEAFSNVT